MKCPNCKNEVASNDGAMLGLLGWKCASCGHPVHDYAKESISDTSLASTGHRERASQTEQNAPSDMSLPLGMGVFVFGLALVFSMPHLMSQPQSSDIASSSPKQVVTNLKPTTDNTITANQDARISGVIPDNDTRRVIPQAQSEQVRYGEQDGKYSPRIYAPYNRTHAGRLEWLMPRPGDDSSAEFSKQCASEEGCVFFHLTKPGVAHVASGWITGDIARIDFEGHNIIIEDGRFTEVIRLPVMKGLPGLNKYTVRATDTSGNTTSMNIYLELKQTKEPNPFEELEGQIDDLDDRIEDLER